MNPLPTHDAPPQALRRTLLIGLSVYAIVWVLLPVWLARSFPLDVVESLTWGREWQWGYHKHPPLAPVVLHSFYLLLGPWGPYLLSQVCLGLTIWLVWRTGRRLMPADRALVGAVLMMGVFYYTQPALEFNHNIAQMPVWAALALVFLAALQDGRWWQWLALGVLAGLGLLTKYSVAVLLASLGLFLLCTPARKALRGMGPWLALLAMAVVFLPHLLWLQQADWLPFSYAGERASEGGQGGLIHALGFAGTQWLNHLPLLLVAGAAAWLARREVRGGGEQAGDASDAASARDRVPPFLLAVALGPCALVVLAGVLTGARLKDMWGVPMWVWSGLLLVALLPPRWWRAMQMRLVRGLLVWLLLISLLTMAYVAWGAQWRQRPSRMDWPAADLTAQASQAWHQHARCKLDVVAGNYWLAGLVVTGSPERPSILMDADPRYSPWVSLGRLRQTGALWIWDAGEAQTPPAVPSPLDRLQDAAGVQVFEGRFDVPWHFRPQGKPLAIGWRAYVPADCVREAGSTSRNTPQ